MRALLDDLTVIDHKNLVGMAHGFQPVGDHDDRLIVGQRRDSLHQLLFVFRVNIGRGLVQNDDRRGLHNRPGDGNALGALVGSLIKFNTAGIEFVMTALFTVMLVNRWEQRENRRPASVGLLCTLLCLLLFGADNFMIPAMAAVIAVLTLMKGKEEAA